jgi:ankyrin repeat protein
MYGQAVSCVAVAGLTFSLLAAAAGAAERDLRLVEAAKNRDIESVRALVKQRLDPNTPQPDGATALHWAAQWDDHATAEVLLAAGADANAVNAYGVTPLALACTNGSGPMVERLLRAGARPDAALATGEPPLMIAARTGSVEAMKALVARGADVNARGTERRQTALMWAAAERQSGVVRLLLEIGADANARSSTGHTALLFAARNGDRSTTELLLAAGADIDEAADDGVTPLLMATLRAHIDYAAFLLERGAKANLVSAGYSPLHWAAGDWDSEVTSGAADGSEWDLLGGIRGPRKLEFVKLLLARGADPNARITRSPRRFGGGGGNLVGATPFLLAAGAGDVDVMRALLDAGADPGITTAQGTTPLMMAAGLTSIQGVDRVPESNAVAAVRLCLELGGDVRATNEMQETALHGAVYKGSNEIVKILVDRGADVNAADRMKQTPLSLAEGVYRAGAFIILPETAELLRKFGARPNPGSAAPAGASKRP